MQKNICDLTFSKNSFLQNAKNNNLVLKMIEKLHPMYMEILLIYIFK